MKSRRPETPTSANSRPAASRASSSSAKTASSEGIAGASTSGALDGSGEPPPLAYPDVEPVLARVRPPPAAILVGGQALNFWVEYYQLAHAVGAGAPLTSKDIDFVAAQDAAEHFARELGGRVQIADMDHATANAVVVHFVDSAGNKRVVDFLQRLCGVDPADLQRTALRVTALDAALRETGFQITVMHPVVCMESRISNTLEYAKYQGEHGRLQARMSILCARAFILDLLDQGEELAARKLNERIFRFTLGKKGRAAFARFQLDTAAALVADERFTENFRTVRFPQMLKEIAVRRIVRARGRGHGGRSR